MRIKMRRASVPATAAAKTFGALVDQVRERGETYGIESRGTVVAEIGPAPARLTFAEFRRLMTTGPRAPVELLDAVERAADDAAPPSARPLSGRGGRRRR